MTITFPTDDHERVFKHLLTKVKCKASLGETEEGEKCLFVRPQNVDVFNTMMLGSALKDCPASNGLVAYLRAHPAEMIAFVWSDEDETIALGAVA